jgi:polar amino acid transport system substrate-binding protein
MTITSAIRSAFTPAGKLRASINLGNPILAYADPAAGAKERAFDLVPFKSGGRHRLHRT